jgi:hypothetical protein
MHLNCWLICCLDVGYKLFKEYGENQKTQIHNQKLKNQGTTKF